MTFDMQYFNVYYFCHLANESMGKIEKKDSIILIESKTASQCNHIN